MGFLDQKPAYDVLIKANTGEVYEVEVVKSNGYNNWINATKVDGSATTSNTGSISTPAPARSTTTSTPSPKSTFETPEERAKKQVYIVRQSSISSAIDTLSVGSKAKLDPKEVIEVAQVYESFVFGNASADVADPYVPAIPSDLDNDDIPF
jgi:hypothetical protein